MLAKARALRVACQSVGGSACNKEDRFSRVMNAHGILLQGRSTSSWVAAVQSG